jgi:aspartate/methionine/tyrosine aminotransferase
VLSEESMRKIVEFAYEKNLTIFADEVYQENIWSD